MTAVKKFYLVTEMESPIPEDGPSVFAAEPEFTKTVRVLARTEKEAIKLAVEKIEADPKKPKRFDGYEYTYFAKAQGTMTHAKVQTKIVADVILV